MPAAYVCTKLEPPALVAWLLSPKSQNNVIFGEPLDVSVKVTPNGSVPEVGLAVKLAVGPVPTTVKVALLLVTVPAMFDTMTEYSPASPANAFEMTSMALLAVALMTFVPFNRH